MNLTLIITAIRALASVAPVIIREGHGDRVERTLNTLATLAERGEEAFGELRELAGKLQTMDGVSRLEKEGLWAEIESLHDAIQEAAKKIPPKEPPAPPADQDPPAGDPTPPAGDSGGSGDEKPTE